MRGQFSSRMVLGVAAGTTDKPALTARGSLQAPAIGGSRAVTLISNRRSSVPETVASLRPPPQTIVSKKPTPMAPLAVANARETEARRQRMASKDQMDLEVEERINSRRKSQVREQDVVSIHQLTAQSHVGDESPDEEYKSCNHSSALSRSHFLDETIDEPPKPAESSKKRDGSKMVKHFPVDEVDDVMLRKIDKGKTQLLPSKSLRSNISKNIDRSKYLSKAVAPAPTARPSGLSTRLSINTGGKLGQEPKSSAGSGQPDQDQVNSAFKKSQTQRLNIGAIRDKRVNAPPALKLNKIGKDAEQDDSSTPLLKKKKT